MELAAFITATENFLKQTGSNWSIGFITSDEEGAAHHGTKKVMEWLNGRTKNWTGALSASSSSTAFGDIIKNGRRGSLHGHFDDQRDKGHVAYPHLARNPIHDALPPPCILWPQKFGMRECPFPAHHIPDNKCSVRNRGHQCDSRRGKGTF